MQTIHWQAQGGWTLVLWQLVMWRQTLRSCTHPMLRQLITIMLFSTRLSMIRIMIQLMLGYMGIKQMRSMHHWRPVLLLFIISTMIRLLERMIHWSMTGAIQATTWPVPCARALQMGGSIARIHITTILTSIGRIQTLSAKYLRRALEGRLTSHWAPGYILIQ